jgi:hypothetical protein
MGVQLLGRTSRISLNTFDCHTAIGASPFPHLIELTSGCVTMPTTLSQHQNHHDRPQHTETFAQEA